jgi:hypothetical protein
MPKVFGIHEIELKPDADPDEYERFCRAPLASQPVLDGWKFHFLKADRGARTGKFAWLYEIESSEARNRYFPAEDDQSDEFTRLVEQPEVVAATKTAEGFEQAEVTTDYLVISL